MKLASGLYKPIPAEETDIQVFWAIEESAVVCDADINLAFAFHAVGVGVDRNWPINLLDKCASANMSES